MKKVFYILLVSLAASVCFAVDGVNTVNHPAAVNGVATPDKVCGVAGLAAGGCSGSWNEITDTFNSLTGWTQDEGTWSATSGQISQSETYTEAMLRNDTTLTCAYCQHVVFRFDPDPEYNGFMLRAGSSGGSWRYVIIVNNTENDIDWYKVQIDGSNPTLIASNTSADVADYTYWHAIEICGEGDSTVLRYWYFASAPTNGPNTWGTPKSTVTNPGGGAASVNTGNYVGLYSNLYGTYATFGFESDTTVEFWAGSNGTD